MSRVVVAPSGSQWTVKVNGVTKSNHRKKRRAVDEGRKQARRVGATLEVRRRNGTVQNRINPRGGR